MSPILTWEDGAHGSEGVDLEGVHLPLGTEANHFHTHQQEAHCQKTDVHALTDDRKPEDTWKHQWEKFMAANKSEQLIDEMFYFGLCCTNLEFLLASVQWSCDTFLPDHYLEEQQLEVSATFLFLKISCWMFKLNAIIQGIQVKCLSVLYILCHKSVLLQHVVFVS